MSIGCTAGFWPQSQLTNQMFDFIPAHRLEVSFWAANDASVLFAGVLKAVWALLGPLFWRQVVVPPRNLLVAHLCL